MSRRINAGAPVQLELTEEQIDPKRLISVNRRIHHQARARVCAYWRQLGHDLVTQEYGYADVGETWHQRVHITVWFTFPTARLRDVNNLYPFVTKPLVDGFVDARLLPDDNDTHLVGPDHRRDPVNGPHRIRIEIKDTP